MRIRAEAAADYAAIEALVGLAFGGRPNEPALVGRLREEPGHRPDLALVALHGARLVGHVMLSPVDLVTPDAVAQVLVLAPLSVHPDAQGAGVGSALVRHALDLADATGAPAVVVLGDPAYYRRFGFEAALTRGVHPPDGLPIEAFSIRLGPGMHHDLRGTVRFPVVFAETGTL